MRVTLYLGDDSTGGLLGTLDVSLAQLDGNTLLVSGADAQLLPELLGRLEPEPENVLDAVFSLATPDAEYQGCQITALGSIVRVDFKTERRRR